MASLYYGLEFKSRANVLGTLTGRLFQQSWVDTGMKFRLTYLLGGSLAFLTSAGTTSEYPVL